MRRRSYDSSMKALLFLFATELSSPTYRLEHLTQEPEQDKYVGFHLHRNEKIIQIVCVCVC